MNLDSRRLVEHMRLARRARRIVLGRLPLTPGRLAATMALSPAERRTGLVGFRQAMIGASLLLCYLVTLGIALHLRLSTVTTAQSPILAMFGRPLDDLMGRTGLLGTLELGPITSLPGRGGTAEVAAWSPDGRYLAVGYSAGSLLVWDERLQQLAHFDGVAHHGFISALSWSPDGRSLVTASVDGTTTLWRLGTGWSQMSPVWVWHSTAGPVPAVAFSPSGTRVAIADGLHHVTVWSTPSLGASSGHPSPRLLQSLAVAGHTTALAWSAHSTELAVGTSEGTVTLWETQANWRQVTVTLSSTVWSLTWNPQTPTLAVGAADGTVRLLNGLDAHWLQILPPPRQRTAVLQIPNYGSSSSPSAPTSVQPSLAVGPAINTMEWSPDGQLLAITAVGAPARFWQPSTGQVLVTYRQNWDMNAVAWSPDGSLVAIAADDGRVTLLNVVSQGTLAAQPLCRMGWLQQCALSGTAPAALHASAPTSFMGR